jgi:hypothetical protein
MTRLQGWIAQRGKQIVIDVTNPLDFSKGMPPRLAIGHTDSGGETIQRLLPDAKVVKAFKIVCDTHMYRPDFPGGPPTMFICGDDDTAKNTVRDILIALGWDTIHIGDIEGSRLLEPLAILWIVHYFRTNNGNHVFKLLQKNQICELHTFDPNNSGLRDQYLTACMIYRMDTKHCVYINNRKYGNQINDIFIYFALIPVTSYSLYSHWLVLPS